ncbi:MAG TPA: hypothetical protein VM433_08780 [Mycobacteriales bacterium]|nr:hypothetical protein [Mycobacteriales bacterium]
MRRLLAASAAAVLPFAFAGVAYAAPDQFEMTPTSGPAGTTVTVSDDEGECAPPEGSEDPFVAVVLFDPDDEAVTGNDASLEAAGNFSLTFTVPDDAPAGTYVVGVACFEGNDEDEEPFFVFEEQEFTVTAAQQQPSPAPEQTRTPAPEQTQTPSRQAPAATAVQGQPRFTG